LREVVTKAFEEFWGKKASLERKGRSIETELREPRCVVASDYKGLGKISQRGVESRHQVYAGRGSKNQREAGA